MTNKIPLQSTESVESAESVVWHISASATVFSKALENVHSNFYRPIQQKTVRLDRELRFEPFERDEPRELQIL